MKESKSHLSQALERLDESAKKIIQTRGYTRKVDKLKLLEELIKEQLRNENSNHSARPAR